MKMNVFFGSFVFPATFVSLSAFAQMVPQPRSQMTLAQSDDPISHPKSETPSFSAGNADASRFVLGANVGAYILLGSAADVLKTGYGMLATAEVEINPKLSAGGALGYSRHSLKEIGGLGSVEVDASMSVVPVVGTFKYALESLNEGLFFGTDAGFYNIIGFHGNRLGNKSTNSLTRNT